MHPIAQLVLATLVFLAAHLVARTPLRATLVKALGERGYLGAYSLASLAILVWMVRAYSLAPLVPLWPSGGLRLLPLVVMPFALILIVAGLMTRNPTAVMQSQTLESAAPVRGIIRVTRHPVMWGIALWAGVHILARGDLASLVFFGGFLLLAAAGTLLIDRRRASALGTHWQRFAAATSNLPFAAIAGGRNRFDFGEIGWRRIGAGCGLYGVVLVAHPYLFGARPY